MKRTPVATIERTAAKLSLRFHLKVGFWSFYLLQLELTDMAKKLRKEANKHKLTFADQIEGENLTNVFSVQSFKKYNSNMVA